MRTLTYAEALNEGLRESMREDDSVFVIGEDIGYYGVTRDLVTEFGPSRVFRTPISESAIVGAAVGAAATGLRPVAEIMYFDFITTAMDQIVNQAAKLSYMSGGRVNLPLVIRTPGGAGTREAGQHSQSLEAWFVHTPGLKVVMPSTPYDAKGLLRSSIRDRNPVLFIDHKLLMGRSQEVPEGTWDVPLGEAALRAEGEDLTLVASSYMVCEAEEAARVLADEMSVEVVDLRTLVPLDIETILRSVEKTGRLLVAHDACTRCGMGAEIVREVVERGFDYLDAPPRVVGAAHVPVPYSAPLEDTAIPRRGQLIEAARKLLDT